MEITDTQLPRAMESADAMLQFCLAFAYQADLPSLERTDRKMLKKLLGEFFNSKGDPGRDRRIKTVIEKGPQPRDFTNDDVEKLQKETRAFLECFVSGERQAFPSRECRFTFTFGSTVPVLTFSGSPSAMFLLRLAFLLIPPSARASARLKKRGDTVHLIPDAQLITGPKLRRCPAPSSKNPKQPCNNLFVRIRKQKYCSKTCTDRVAQQEKREREQPRLRSRKKTA